MIEQLEQLVENRENQNNVDVRIKDFQTPKDRITSGYLNLVGIYLLAKESLPYIFSLGQPQMEFVGNKEFDFNLRTSYFEGPDLRNPCGDREIRALSGIKMIIDPKDMIMREEYTFHEESAMKENDEKDSGENVTHSFLNKNGKPVLMSVQYLAYETDHSGDDYPTNVIRRTELLDKSDGIAEFIFGHVKNMKTNGVI